MLEQLTASLYCCKPVAQGIDIFVSPAPAAQELAFPASGSCDTNQLSPEICAFSLQSSSIATLMFRAGSYLAGLKCGPSHVTFLFPVKPAHVSFYAIIKHG